VCGCGGYGGGEEEGGGEEGVRGVWVLGRLNCAVCSGIS
jgi:hypothetical protein